MMTPGFVVGEAETMIEVIPIGYGRGGRAKARDDYWAREQASIDLTASNSRLMPWPD